MERKLTCGDFRALEALLVEEVIASKSGDILAPVIVLVGSQVLARHLDLVLADRLPQGGHVNVRIITLRNFCSALTAGEQGLPPIPKALSELKVRRLIRGLGSENPFKRVADRPGLASVLLSTFDDIEQSGFASAPPEPKSGDGKVDRAKVAAVLKLYKQYRAELKGKFSERADVIEVALGEMARVPDLFGADRVIVYGFYDFNGLQRRLIDALVEALGVLVLFPCQARAACRYSESASGWLESRGFERSALAEPQAVKSSDLEALRSRWGEQSRGALRDAGDGSVRMISAPGEAREVREMSREIITAAGEKSIPFHDMAVVLANRDLYMPLIREEFARARIPYYSVSDRTLAETREGRSLLMMAGLAGADLPRQGVMSLLGFAPLDVKLILRTEGVAPRPEMWRHITAEANIIAGIDQWRERLRAHAGERAKRDEDTGREPDTGLTDDIDELLAFIGMLNDGLESVPAKGTLSEMCDPLLELFKVLIKDVPGPADYHGLVIEAIEELSRMAGAESISREDFVRMVEEHLASKPVGVGKFRQNGVNILDLMPSRGASFRLVLVPGLVEKSFPRPAREDPVLLDDERRAINREAASSAYLPLKIERAPEDRLLFQLAISAATERLVLSYPRVDSSNDRPRIPSFFMLQAAEALTGRRINYEGFDSLPAPLYRRASLIPGAGLDADQALDEHEFSLTFMHPLRGSRAAAMRAHLKKDMNVKRAVEMFSSRYRSDGFDRFDGMIGKLGGEYVSRLDRISTGSLESYTECPYKFFHEKVLRVRKEALPEDPILITPIDKGTVFHALMASFADGFRALPDMPPEELPARSGQLLDKVALDCFEAFERTGKTGVPTTWERQKEELLLAARAVAREMAMMEGYENFCSEEGFEVAVSDGGDVIFTVSGRIDRVDFDEAACRLQVVDYKSGREPYPVREDFRFRSKKGNKIYLQPVSYVFGACSLLGRHPGELEWTACLHFPFHKRADKQKLMFGGATCGEDLATFLGVLAQVKACMEEGIFIRLPDKDRACKYCDYAMACPVDRYYLDRRKGGALDHPELSKIYNREACGGTIE